MDYNNYRLIIVIGLSHSGKTTYCKKYISSHILYDDFIPYFYEGKIVRDIKDNKKKLVLNDPRLCNYTIFQLYMNIFEKYVKKKDILLILFQNNVQKCIKNIKKDDTLKDAIQKYIEYHSKTYDIKNYKEYNNIII